MLTKTVVLLGLPLECRYTVSETIIRFESVIVAGGNGTDLKDLLNHMLLGRIDPTSGGLGVTPVLSLVAEMLEPSTPVTTIGEIGTIDKVFIH